MKKIGIIILSFLILNQSVYFDLDDLIKFPALFSHLSSHIEKGDSLGNFISLHYGKKVKSHENKHQEHRKLPFKNQQIENHYHSIFTINRNSFQNRLTVVQFNNKNFSYKDILTTQLTEKIFQPPKVA